jgi:hypothetical protein
VANDLTSADFPEQGDTAVLDWWPSDEDAIRLNLTIEQIRAGLKDPVLRYVMAQVKRSCRVQMDRFFDASMAIPKGLEQASPREAFAQGLVSLGRYTLCLQRELLVEAEARLAKQKRDETPRAVEGSPFAAAKEKSE